MLDEYFANEDDLPVGCNYEQFIPQGMDEYEY